MNKKTIIIEEPAISRLLFADARLALLWLASPLGPAKIKAGWMAQVHRSKWMNNGQALLDYWQEA